MLYIKIYQHLEDLINSVDQFSKWPMHDVMKSYRGRRSIQSANRAMDFNLEEYEKLIAMVSDSSL